APLEPARQPSIVSLGLLLCRDGFHTVSVKYLTGRERYGTLQCCRCLKHGPSGKTRRRTYPRARVTWALHWLWIAHYCHQSTHNEHVQSWRENDARVCHVAGPPMGYFVVASGSGTDEESCLYPS